MVGEAGFENCNEARSTNDAAQMTFAPNVPSDETIREASVEDRGALIRASKLEDLFAQIRSAVEQRDAAGAIVIVDLLREVLSSKVETNGQTPNAWEHILREDV